MQKLYSIVRVIMIFVLLFTQNNLQAQKCCVECQADVKVVSDKQVLLEKIDIKEGTSLINVNTNVYVSYRSGNAQKFWANLAIATARVIVSTQLNSNTNVAEGEKTSGISPIVPFGVSVVTLPSIWKNRPRGLPQAGLYIQHRDLRGKLLDTWEQPISNEAKNDVELLTVAINKPLLEGTLEIYLQNGNKNAVYYWGLQTVRSLVADAQLAKLAFPPRTPTYNISPCGPCEIPTYVDNGRGDRVFAFCTGIRDCRDEGELPEVIVRPEPESTPPRGGEHPRPGEGGDGNPPDGGGGIGGGGGNNNNDGPQTKNQGFHFDMLRGYGSIVGDYVTPVVTSFESGTLTRPNSRSQWKFQNFSFSNIGVEGRLLFEVWTVSTLNPISNIESDGSYASMDHTWQLTRTAALGEIILGGAGTSHPHNNQHGYNAN